MVGAVPTAGGPNHERRHLAGVPPSPLRPRVSCRPAQPACSRQMCSRREPPSWGVQGMASTWVRMVTAVAAVGLVAAACGDDGDGEASDTTTASTEATGAPTEGGLVIGALLPESGALSAIIQSLRVPMDLALEEINGAGGVLGGDVRIAAADDGTDDLTIAQTGWDRLVSSDGVNAVIGPASSTLTEGLMSQIASSDVLACSGSNTAAGLEDLEDNGRYFGLAPNDNLQGPALAEVVVADGHGSVAILVRNDTYGTGFGDAVAEALGDLGVDVPFNEAYDPEGDSFTAETERLAASGADAAVVIGFSTDGGKVVSAMIERGIGPTTLPLYTGDGMQGSSFWEAVGDSPALVQGIKGTAPAAAPEGVEHPFQEQFAATGTDTIFSAYIYDCFTTLALAAEAAGSTDVDAMIEAMGEITSGDTPCVGFAECKELLTAGDSIKVSGASGPLDLNEGGHVTSGAYDIWQYDPAGEPQTLDEPQIIIGR
ncbi:MAG: ABC transporter substrate-binding protein [Acidimicrobiia bacterium]|nr:ABC transporter substrate-binding protein [Acidimicrobiia bacterium]